MTVASEVLRRYDVTPASKYKRTSNVGWKKLMVVNSKLTAI
ncbi:hypothetical protein [Cohnella sp.]